MEVVDNLSIGICLFFSVARSRVVDRVSVTCPLRIPSARQQALLLQYGLDCARSTVPTASAREQVVTLALELEGCAGSTVPRASARKQAVVYMLKSEACVWSTVPTASARQQVVTLMLELDACA